MRYITIFLAFFFILSMYAVAQAQKIEGYVFESGNRGYLNAVKMELVDGDEGIVIQKMITDADGFFMFDLPNEGNYILKARKEIFEVWAQPVDLDNMSNGKLFIKVEMTRKPGYQFEVTLAPKRWSDDITVDAIKGARIEVYNNTTKKEVLVLEEHPDPEFALNMLKGNHYTILIRKKGFLAKRMEAYVDVEGCILCFEGVGKVQPGVVDNLTEGNQMGVLLANVELERDNTGKKMEIQNIYYDLGKASLRWRSKRELKKVITLLRDNPTLAVEIGSHTDARGTEAYNQELSERRAKSVVDYLKNVGDIAGNRLIYRGYGESNLVNDCVNSVKCSEAKHQENRRTELKIVGKIAEKAIVPLSEMKRQEQMESMIEELQNQEQIRVENPADIPTLQEQKKATKVIEEQQPVLREALPNEIIEGSTAINQKQKTKITNKSSDLEKMLDVTKVIEPVLDINGFPYTGYKIVYKEKKGLPYPFNHKEVNKFPDRQVYYKDGKVFLYLTGTYNSYDKASQGLRALDTQGYYIIEFKKGHPTY